MLACRRFAVAAMATAQGDRPIATALQDVSQRIAAAVAKAPRERQTRLVAVSKTKPAEAVLEAYQAGHRDFGENYVQELVDKAAALPPDIRWHFIGHLQSNKVKAVVEGVPNLAMVETVDSVKLADRLDKAVSATQRSTPLPVMVQVNTSGEASKHGVEPADCVALAAHIARHCRRLQLAGLMTIGQPDYSSRPENFSCLWECRRLVAAELGLDPEALELSMGMSGDFEQAVEMGSTNVRVGSTIFGARHYPPPCTPPCTQQQQWRTPHPLLPLLFFLNSQGCMLLQAPAATSVRAQPAAGGWLLAVAFMQAQSQQRGGSRGQAAELSLAALPPGPQPPPAPSGPP
ncbi:hypothetical protein V8C86DRAFT_3141493 [Haematococcus lacustris]